MGILHEELTSVIKTQLREMRNEMSRPDLPDMDAGTAYQWLIPDQERRQTLLGAGVLMPRARTEFDVSIRGGSVKYFQARGSLLLSGSNNGGVGEFLKPAEYEDTIVDLTLSRALAPYHEVANDWAEVIFAFERLDALLSEVAQFNFFMPWLSQLNLGGLNNGVHDGHKYQRPMQQAQQLTSKRKPSRIPVMPRQLLDTCRMGGRLLAQLQMIRSAPKKNIASWPADGMARISLSLPHAVANTHAWRQLAEVWRATEGKF